MARNKEFDPIEKLEVARNLFWQKGYNATSMQDLVDTMGLNRGSIYDTYGDKHSLYLQCLTNYVGQNKSVYGDKSCQCSSPLNTIGNIINKVIDAGLKSGMGSCMAVKSTQEMAGCDKDVKKIIKDNSTQVSAMFKELVQKAQAAKEVRADLDAGLVADFITSSFCGFWQNYALFGNATQVRKMAALLVEGLKA